MSAVRGVSNTDETQIEKAKEFCGGGDEITVFLSEIHELNEECKEQYGGRVRLEGNIFKKGTKFAHQDIRLWELTGSSLENASFKGATLGTIMMNMANMSATDANFNGAVAKDPENNTFFEPGRGTSFFGSNLARSTFVKAQLTGANFVDVNLEGADFESAKLDNALFTRAFLPDAKFGKASLKNTSFILANMDGVDFGSQNFDGMDLSGAILNGAIFGEDSSFDNVKFCETRDKSWYVNDVKSREWEQREDSSDIEDMPDGDNGEEPKLNKNNIEYYVGQCVPTYENFAIAGGFRQTSFKNAIIKNVAMTSVNVSNLDFTGANLDGSFFFGKNNLSGTILIGASMKDVKLDSAILESAILTDANLARISLKNSMAESADFDNAIFWEMTKPYETADLSYAELSGATFRGADLRGAIFINADLDTAAFHNADLTGATFQGADLSNARFTGAILEGVDFGGIEEINWMGVRLKDANLFGATNVDIDILKKYTYLCKTKLPDGTIANPTCTQ